MGCGWDFSEREGGRAGGSGGRGSCSQDVGMREDFKKKERKSFPSHHINFIPLCYLLCPCTLTFFSFSRRVCFFLPQSLGIFLPTVWRPLPLPLSSSILNISLSINSLENPNPSSQPRAGLDHAPSQPP